MPIAENIKLPQKDLPRTSWIKRALFPVSAVAGELKRIKPDIYDYFFALIVVGIIFVVVINQNPWSLVGVFVMYFGMYFKIKTTVVNTNNPTENGGSDNSIK